MNHRWTRQCVAEPALKTEKPVQVTGVGVPPVEATAVQMDTDKLSAFICGFIFKKFDLGKRSM
jgi:hypothetical protein